MEQLDSSARHELSKLGYAFARNVSASHVVKSLLKDINKLRNVSEDLNQLSRRNNDLSLSAMLYKTQLEEKEAEAKILAKRSAQEKAGYEEQIKTLEEMLPRTVEMPKSNILQVLGVKEADREALELIRYADTKLHELETSNKTLMIQLDKNVTNSGVLISKIKLRDAEIQRLTQLVNSESCNLDLGEASASNVRNKLLREENVRLQSEIDHLKADRGDMTANNDLRSQLARAVDERKDLARQLDNYTSKVTALQKLLYKYEHELKMARLERDKAVDKTYGNDASTATCNEAIRENVQDENGNVTNYGETEQRREFAQNQRNDVVKVDKLSVYERKVSKLLKDLSQLQDAVTKKDKEITRLRGEIAIVGAAHEENLKLRSEVSSLKRTATEFKNEIRQLREHVKQFTATAARAADAAVQASMTEFNVRDFPEDEMEEDEEEEGPEEEEPPPSPLPAASRRAQESRVRTAATVISSGEEKNRAKSRAQRTASLEAAPVLLEKVALLESEMRRLQAQAALDVENRLRTETRLREMEQNPPKKFKGLLKIDGGLMRTEFEMRDDSSD